MMLYADTILQYLCNLKRELQVCEKWKLWWLIRKWRETTQCWYLLSFCSTKCQIWIWGLWSLIYERCKATEYWYLFFVRLFSLFTLLVYYIIMKSLWSLMFKIVCDISSHHRTNHMWENHTWELSAYCPPLQPSPLLQLT